MATKRREKNPKWISNIGKLLDVLEEEPKAKIHIDSLGKYKKKSKRKTPSHNDIHGFWLKNSSTSLTDKQSK